MAKRRKQKSRAIPPKVQYAQHRKAFIRKLKYFAEALGIDDFELLAPPELLGYIFDLRFDVSSLTSNANDVPNKVLKSVRESLEEFLKGFRFAFIEDGPDVTLRDFLSVGMSLYFSLNSEKNPFDLETLKKRFADYFELIEKDAFPFEHLGEGAWMATLEESSLDAKMYWIKHSYQHKNCHLTNHFELCVVRPEQKRVIINGTYREVIRVGWAIALDGPSWISMDAHYFTPHKTKHDASLPVYIQAHALHRMNERLDCIDVSYQHLYLYFSLQEPNIVENGAGQKLIEYHYQGNKLGYLVADVVDKIVVIRTFLFITMDSTPEGEALQQAIGLKAVDKKYLTIDRLSTFILSDISKHHDIKELFTKAGCTDLFNFDTSALEPEHQIELGQFIRKYLDTNRSKTLAVSSSENAEIATEVMQS